MASIEEVRLNVALANPTMTSAEVRAEAERVVSVLDGIEAADNLKAAIAAQQAEADQQKAAEAQLRAEAVADARSIVAKSHPGYDAAGIESEAQKLVSENESALAALALRASLAEGYDRQ